MGTRKNLNGLPNSLEQRYFSTLFYWNGGYMADWIWNAANEKNVKDIEIDILNENVEPKVLQIKPIIGHLPQLRNTIQITLKSNDFPIDFISEAKFIIYISQKHIASRLLTCQCVVTDKEGRKYLGKIYTEKAFEDPYQVFPHSLFQRIKKIMWM
ncbi:MAG: hypothetical protein IPN60_21060 [Saprospiraceae bacterium]|nr:hypothetical protein [Candidatus Opimibacter skivensis]